MGQRSEPDARRRPTSGPRLLRAADVQRDDTPGQPDGTFGVNRRGSRVRQTPAGQRRVYRAGCHVVRPDFRQHRGQVPWQVGPDHVASSRQQSREVSLYI